MSWTTVILIGVVVVVTAVVRFVLLRKVSGTAAQARIVLLLAVLGIILLGMGLAQWRENSLTRQKLDLNLVTDGQTFETMARQGDLYVLIAGDIREGMSTSSEGYVSYLRLERSATGDNDDRDSYSDYRDLDVVLDDGTVIDVSRSYGSRPMFRYNYYNWPREEDTFYTYYYLAPEQPVVVLGRPVETSNGFDIHNTAFVFAGTHDDYVQLYVEETRPWLPVAQGAVALALGMVLLTAVSLVPTIGRIQQDPSFKWQDLLGEVQVG